MDNENKTNESNETVETIASPAPPVEKGFKSKLRRFKSWYGSHKKISLPLTIIVILVVILAVPVTRYKVLGMFIKKDLSILVIDSSTNKPVSDVALSLDGISGQTDKDGKAILHAPVGGADLSLTKKYYKDQTVPAFVGLSQSGSPLEIKFEATGRQVPVRIVNKIEDKPLENAQITAAETSATTDKDGKAVIVLPQNSPTVEGLVKLEGYNDQKVTIQVTEDEVDGNTFQVTPVGKLYFLSKRSGKIDVVKTNLDGSERKTVLAGTGKEDESNTILLASRDWKYLALLSKRDGPEKLYLIETATDELSVIDEGNATFTLSGWLNDNFVYTVDRKNVHEWQNRRSSIKSFNAGSKNIVVINDSKGVGDGEYNYAEQLGQSIYLTSDKIVFANAWGSGYESEGLLKGKKSTIVSVNPDGSDNKILKSFSPSSYINAVAYNPEEIYFSVNGSDNKTTYYEYEDGQIIKADGLDEDTFYNKFYPTYLLSPSGKQTSWYEPRDGKNTLFVGDSEGSNGRQVSELSEFVPYGWYSDDYLLYSKNDSELYIVPANGPGAATDLKVTDYHKPEVNFSGYGGGYGGF